MIVWVRMGMLGSGSWDRMLEPARVVSFVHDVAVNIWSVIRARHECCSANVINVSVGEQHVDFETICQVLDGRAEVADAIARVKEHCPVVAFYQVHAVPKRHEYALLAPGYTNHELTGVNEALQERGYQPFIMIDDHHDDNKVRSVQSLVRQGVDGVIFGAARLTAEHMRSLYELEVPVLLLGQSSESLPYVKVDDFAAGKTMGEYVRDANPSSVVYLSLPLYDRAAGMERQQGFQSAFNGVAIRVTYIEGDHGVEAGYAMASDVIAAEPDFVVCASDSMCYGLMHAFDERGLRVPEDTRLAGFGDYEASSLPGVSLTSISFGYEDLGREAATRAVALVEGHEVEWRSIAPSVTLHARRSSSLSQSEGANVARHRQ